MSGTNEFGRQEEPRPLTVSQAIRRRRATRRFEPDRPIPEDELCRLLELATMAPSGFNLQPWRFILIRDPANLRRLRACAFNQPKVTEASAVVIVLGYHHPHRSHLEKVLWMQEERGLLTSAQVSEVRARATQTMERVADRALWATRSTMLAASTLMLAAESVGVSSAPMEGFAPEAVRDQFGVPEDHSICCLIALGYAAEEKPFPGRLKLDEVCFEERFGQPWKAVQVDTPIEKE